MITGFISAVFAIFVYWIFWLIWLWIAPSLLGTDTDEMLVRPKFWQFIIVAITLSMIFASSNKK